MADLRVDFCGVPFENPFILAASPSTDNREMTARGLETGWAGAVLKTTSLESEEVSIAYPIMSGIRPGAGLVGLQNTDLLSERHIHEIAEDIAWLKQRLPEKRIIASLMGSTRSEWRELVTISEQAGADMIEASISCPQGAELEGEQTQGWMVSQDARQTEMVTHWVVEASKNIPVYVKLSPSVTDIRSIGRAVELGGGNGICAIDCLEGIGGIDLATFSPLPSVQGKGTRGGYSGRAIKPVGLRVVADLAGAVKIPISGVGGIYDWRDALEYLLLGAGTVQVCTAVLQRGFGMINPLTDGLNRWLDDHRYSFPRGCDRSGAPAPCGACGTYPRGEGDLAHRSGCMHRLRAVLPRLRRWRAHGDRIPSRSGAGCPSRSVRGLRTVRPGLPGAGVYRDCLI